MPCVPCVQRLQSCCTEWAEEQEDEDWALEQLGGLLQASCNSVRGRTAATWRGSTCTTAGGDRIAARQQDSGPPPHALTWQVWRLLLPSHATDGGAAQPEAGGLAVQHSRQRALPEDPQAAGRVRLLPQARRMCVDVVVLAKHGAERHLPPVACKQHAEHHRPVPPQGAA